MVCYKFIKNELIEKYNFTPFTLGVEKTIGLTILRYTQKGFYIKNLNDVRFAKINKEKFYGFIADC